MNTKKSKFILTLILIFGLIVGSYIGILLASVLPDGVVKQVFTASINPSIGNIVLDLIAVKISFGLSLNFNLCSIIGILIAAWIFRWY